MPRSKSSPRNRSLGAVHAGRRALGWDEETYRLFIEQITGKRSSSDCSEAQLAAVLDGMRERGFARKEGSAPGVPRERMTQLGKARGLWQELAAIGELTNPSEAGFCAYVERMTRRSRPEWCSPEQLSRVIEGLKAWGMRARTARVPDDRRPVE